MHLIYYYYFLAVDYYGSRTVYVGLRGKKSSGTHAKPLSEHR